MEMEVICISSDESDSQKENKKKSSLLKSAENGNSLQTKADISPSNDEKVEENHFKRKISQISEAVRSLSCSNAEKRRKLSKTSEVDDNSLAKPNCILQSNKKQEVTVEMPKLVVKERKKISYVAHDIFPQFISLCLSKSHEGDMVKIVDRLKRNYEKLDAVYAGSKSFALFLNDKREAIVNSNSGLLYVCIEEVLIEMRKMIKEQSRRKPTNNSIAYDAIPSTSYAANKVNNTAESEDNEDDDTYMKSETRKKIQIIRTAMKKCEIKIKKFEEAEVDFDDEADSNYIKMERYKQKMVELYSKYCELTGCDVDAGRSYLRPKNISTTQIVAVDHAITNFINSKISKRNQLKNGKKLGSFTNNLIFPDYRDILECVSRCNDRRNLSLNKKKQKSLAKKAFVEIGELLQRARRNDYWDTFSLYLENQEEDPAIKDKVLAQKLAHNRIEGDKRLAAVFEQYTKKQEELKDQAADSGTTTEDESDMDDYDKDDDDKDEYKDNDTQSIYTLSTEVDTSDENIDEIIPNDVLPAERSKSPANVSRDTSRIAPGKIETSVPQERCIKRAETKTSARESDVSNKSQSKTVIIEEKVSRAIVVSRNAIGTVAKTPEDSLPTSTTNCADTTGETEEHVAEMMIEDVSKVITDSAAEVISKDGTKVLRKSAPEIITGDIAKVKVTTAVVEEEVTEATEETVTEVLNTEVSGDKLADDAQRQPLLRVRSFAKPPTTWDDGRQGKTSKSGSGQENTPKTSSQNKDVIDLTDESSEPAPASAGATKFTIQLGNKIVPLRSKHQTLILPTGSNIISVQNITNNYLKVDMRTGEIIAPVREVQPSKLIRVPSTQTASTVRQGQLQNASVTTTTSEGPAKRPETVKRNDIIRILPKTIVMKQPDRKVIPKQQQVRALPLIIPK
ncbi:PREDICTED: uncharacterized protein LOC106746336 [Dinoponera quadriceps]|uniref:Uncharacterized protein LOC106746336 n=1 Tax=Dinoponera quadriceps TaxID=609295 RepID=A0A6P3XK15_DINQU|nr:PREDICTED: uncharacterized protein LOC106746336 [Dinoponera quadriceps]